MTSPRCPTCDASLTAAERDAGRCERCGAALPADLRTAVATSPARGGDSIVERPGSRKEEPDPDIPLPDVRNRSIGNVREASGVLFAVAVLQLVCGTAGVLLLAGQAPPGGAVPQEVVLLTVGEIVVTAAVFAGLGFWARYQPFPAALIGLLLYLLLSFAAVVANPQMAGSGLVVKVILVVALARAVVNSARMR